MQSLDEIFSAVVTKDFIKFLERWVEATFGRRYSETAKDAVQVALMKTWRRLQKDDDLKRDLSNPKRLAAYIHTSVLNQVYTLERRKEPATNHAEAWENPISVDYSHLERGDADRLVKTVIGGASEQAKNAMRVLCLAPLDRTAMGAQLGVHKHTVGRWLHDGLDELRDLVELIHDNEDRDAWATFIEALGGLRKAENNEAAISPGV